MKSNINNKKLSVFLNLSPLIFTIGIVLFSIIKTKMSTGINPINGEIITYNVIDKIIYSAIGLATILSLVLLKIQYWKHFYTILLITSTIGLTQFYPTTFSFMGIKILGLSLLIIHLTLNNEPINDLKRILNIHNNDNNNPEQVDANRVKYFSKKFINKNKSELEEIINSGKFSDEAIEAAKNLKKKE